MDPVLTDRRGAVGLVTLNRPEKLNALNRELVQRLRAALADLDADEAIGAIVLTGAGERAFSAGGDMREQVERLDQRDAAPPAPSASSAVRACTKPVVAAIRGYCYGGGAVLAIACDIRIGGDDARIKFHGASYGLAPGGASLPRIVGEAKAKELLFTCDEVLAPEAWRIGLLNQVVAADRALETAVAMADRIVANSPQAVAIIKATIDRALPIEAALAHEEAANQALRRSPDSSARFRRAAERVLAKGAASARQDSASAGRDPASARQAGADQLADG
jgi:enoyl-CoA hydratase